MNVHQEMEDVNTLVRIFLEAVTVHAGQASSLLLMEDIVLGQVYSKQMMYVLILRCLNNFKTCWPFCK